MITHAIIKEPKKIQQHHGFHSFYPNRSNIKGQPDLDKFLESAPKKHVILKYKSNKSYFEISSFYVVLDVEDKFEKLEFNYMGQPKTHRIISLSNSGYASPRWEDLNDLEQITAEQYDTYVKPHNDHVSYCIAQYKSGRD